MADALAPRKTMKDMTKAERRAVQEVQRAAKHEQQESLETHPSRLVVSENRPLSSKSPASAVPANLRFDDPKARAKTQKLQAVARTSMQKTVSLFSHLPQYEKETSISQNITQQIHPAVLRLGLQFADFKISGANARCMAMLEAFKQVITDYTTPPNLSLTRHLTQHLGPHITYLSEIRPLAASMGSAIRYLKHEISLVGIDRPDADAKAHLHDRIDEFITERISAAGTMIVSTALEKIQEDDVILTYAHSSIVERLLLEAKRLGKTFRVIVVDSRPKYEGRQLLRALVKADIRCTYTLITAASYVIQEATKVLLGAHALLANGSLLSRAGASQISLLAHNNNIPVIVPCETYKFSNKVHLDSIVFNELADPDELVVHTNCGSDGVTSSLQGWRDLPQLKLLNLMFDVTPAEFITVVITEIGSIPGSSVPVVLREYKPLQD